MRAATHTQTSSRIVYAFCPNEPPMSPQRTVNRANGSDISVPKTARSACGFWWAQ